MPKDKEAFVQNTAPAVGSHRAQRISLKVNEDGAIDWDSVTEQQKTRFAELVANDPTALEMIGLKAGEGEAGLEGGGPYVKPEHVVMFLDAYAKCEGFLVPKIIRTKSKGVIVISPEIASEVFKFTDEQKAELAPSGAEWANDTIPESWRQWILENVGPGLKFFGMLGMITMQQTQSAIEMWKKAQGMQAPGTVSVQPPTNGHAEVAP